MKKTTRVCSSEFEALARETISMAFALCEKKMQANKGKASPELKPLSVATESMEKAIETFMAIEQLCK